MQKRQQQQQQLEVQNVNIYFKNKRIISKQVTGYVLNGTYLTKFYQNYRSFVVIIIFSAFRIAQG